MRGFRTRVLATLMALSSARAGESRRFRLGAVLAAVAALLLPAAFAGRSAWIGSGAAATPSSLLDARSPGARPEGALYQTKPARRVLPAAPHQRVLSQVREHPPVAPALPPVAYAPVVPFAPPVLASRVPALRGPFPIAFNPPPSSPTFPLVPPDRPRSIDGGSSGGTVLPPAGGPPDGTVPPPDGLLPPSGPVPLPGSSMPGGAVPEPATWATMIEGFGLLGWTLRRARRRGGVVSRS